MQHPQTHSELDFKIRSSSTSTLDRNYFSRSFFLQHITCVPSISIEYTLQVVIKNHTWSGAVIIFIIRNVQSRHSRYALASFFSARSLQNPPFHHVKRINDSEIMSKPAHREYNPPSPIAIYKQDTVSVPSLVWGRTSHLKGNSDFSSNKCRSSSEKTIGRDSRWRTAGVRIYDVRKSAGVNRTGNVQSQLDVI